MNTSPVYEQNLEILRRQQPGLAEQITRANVGDAIEVTISKSGHAVPVVAGQAFHSLNNPPGEGIRVARMSLPDGAQQRVIIYGLGFGYHVVPLVENGISPSIYEPSLEMIKLAMMHVDLTAVLPFVKLYTGNDVPDVPRCTKVLMHPVTARLYPQQAAALNSKIPVDYPKQTNDIEEGIYYGTYRNVTCLKNPCDLAIYDQIIHLVRPTLILELGVFRGGSALFFADQLRTIGGDRRIHIYDVMNEAAPELFLDPMITFHSGGWQAFDPSMIRSDDRVLVIEDSSHTYENTLAVLRHFAPFVSPNSYLIVEDGAAGGTRPHLNGGPIRAIEEFLQETDQFEADTRWEYFYGKGNSNCLKGFLRRKV